MAYIGNVPSHGEFKKADSIVSSFNGSLTQFDLDYDTVNQTVGDATQLIVSLNGIIQEPGTAYTLGIGGGSIVFASAPASTDTCHIVILGGVGGTTTPTDGSVTASKLDSALKDYLEETFTADGTQTVFTLTRAVVGANTLLVTIDGIVQPSSAFTASGTTLTISEVLAATTNVRVVHMGVKAGIYVPANDSVTADMLANSINTDISSKLPLAGGTLTGNLGVTGTVTADGLTVAQGSGANILLESTTTGATAGDIFGEIEFKTNDSNSSGIKGKIDSYSEGNVGNGALRLFTGDTTGLYQRLNIASNGDISFYEDTGTSAKFFWDASAENLGIGTSSPTELLSVGNTSTQYTRMQFYAATNGASTIHFGDGTSGADNYRGYLNYAHDSNSMQFATNGSERMRIDSSGNLLVGNTSTGLTSDGINLHGNGTLEVRRNLSTENSSTVAYMSRGSSDGNIINFYRDTTQNGSIGTQGGRLTIGDGATGLRIAGDLNTIVPWNTTTNVLRDAAIDLGQGTQRFKDLYLSGGAYLGGTVAANHLDDYEEGTFTPAMTLSTPGNSSFAYLAQSGQYRKVGKIVTFTLELRMNAISYGTGSGSLLINGFPFNFANTGGYGSSLCTIFLAGGAIASGRTPAAQGLSNTANLNLVQMISGAAAIALVVSNYNTIQVSGTYVSP